MFIAINLNEEIKDYLMSAIHVLHRGSRKGNFTHRENLHLNLVFLGETANEKLDDVKKALDKIESKPFWLGLKGFGRFRRNGGDIHWAGIETNESLFGIQRELASNLAKSGFLIEQRTYSPHLTLGREIRLRESEVDLDGEFSGPAPSMMVKRVSLMKSERINGRLTYTEIYGKDLTASEN